MRNYQPRVSIGMPVYNGELFIKDAIDSILAQTFEDFELIISDNASTDKTEEICREYTARDTRVLYYRNEKNLGAAKNFNRVFELSSGEYFKWAAADDIIAPEFLAKAVEILDDPSIILCQSKVKLIDKNDHFRDQYGRILGDYDPTKIRFRRNGKCIRDYEDAKIHLNMQMNNLSSHQPSERFGDLILTKHHWCFEVFGLIRSHILKQTSLIGPYVGSDRVLLAHLGLLGRFAEIPDFLFYNRDHAKRTSYYAPLYLQLSWYDTSKKGQKAWPNLKHFTEYLKLMPRVNISADERRHCYLNLIKWPIVYANDLFKDVREIYIFIPIRSLPFYDSYLKPKLKYLKQIFKGSHTSSDV